MNVPLSIAMFTPVPPAPNSAVPADLPPFVNPPSLTGANPASLLGGQGGGLLGAADPLRAVVKPSESMEVCHQAGNCSACAPSHESDFLKSVYVRKDRHHLTRGHDP